MKNPEIQKLIDKRVEQMCKLAEVKRLMRERVLLNQRSETKNQRVEVK